MNIFYLMETNTHEIKFERYPQSRPMRLLHRGFLVWGSTLGEGKTISFTTTKVLG
jgi:hypothetical protein